MARKIKKRKPLTEEQKKARAEAKRIRDFKAKIRSVFTNMGFSYCKSEGIHFKIGHRVVELDYIFIFENIIIICEDTTSAGKDKDHIRKKNEAISEILNNKIEFFEWMRAQFPDKEKMLSKYRSERFIIEYLYISTAEIELTDDEKALYSNIVFWEPDVLAYFVNISQSTFYSAKYELFRMLEINDEQIGHSGSAGVNAMIKAPIIYPEDTTGLFNGIRVVSFMMSAESLLKNSYVLRKDNWEDSMWLYQRLIDKKKLQGVRKFIAENGTAFYNNIIVALPDTVKFENDSNEIVSIDQVGDYQHGKLVIPDVMNSICIIDGQHRVFAHYEAPETERWEEKIRELRKQLHLLVTGLIFPSDMSELERKRFQSKIFLEINDNAKHVSADVLLHIKMMSDPLSDTGIARKVIERLNRKAPFLNRFELSTLDEGKIKIASIVKFALRYLVSIAPPEGKTSLFEFWTGDKKALCTCDERALNDYIAYCANVISQYFNAVRSAYLSDWNNPEAKLLSVIGINGYIMALNRQLPKNGVEDYKFYETHFKKMQVDFSKMGFKYTSSQYRKFSSQILREAFDFTEEELETI